jgi:hypothetical protein
MCFVVNHTQIIFNQSCGLIFLFNMTKLWIAESAGSLIYKAISGLPNQNSISGCSFNHPDRAYVCMLAKDDEILVGRVGVSYGSIVHYSALYNSA